MLVTDSGPPDARIMIVGEAPGKDEEQKGKPFVGASGQLLRRMLSHSGINFDRCYVTNVVNERPPGNRFEYFYNDKSRREPSSRLVEFRKRLWEKIKEVKPNVVIAVGNEALKAITRKNGIMSWRGTIIMVDGVKVIPTLHPAYILKVYNDHAIVELDFLKALRESQYPEYRKPETEIIIQPSLSDVLSFIQSANFTKRISWDVETIGTHVRCLSLACYGSGFVNGWTDNRKNRRIRSISIPFIKMSDTNMIVPTIGSKLLFLDTQSESSTSYWAKQDEILILDALADLFSNDDIEIVGQNSITFDEPIIKHEFGITISNHYMDTMHAWHELYSELPKSLSFLCSVLTNYQNYWTEKSTEDDKSEWFYNAMDAVVALEVSYVIEEEMKNEGLWDVYKDHKHPLCFALAKAQNIGVLIDKKRQKEIVEEANRELLCLTKEIENMTREGFNPNSPLQVSNLLYNELKFPVMYNKHDKKTTDEESLRKLSKRYPNESILTNIIKYRKTSKLISTYLNVSADDDGRMRTSYNPSGTKGTRISSSKTIWDTGMNLQNIPVREAKGVRNIRDMFIAGDGNILVKGDLRQAETMVVAHILRRLGDNTLYDKYQDPSFDIHTWICRWIFNVEESAVTKDQRDLGKLGNHSGNYMAGPRVLMSEGAKYGLDIDFQMSKKILDARIRAIPGLKVWWNDVDRRLKGTRTLTTCLGRRRMFFGRFDDTTLRDAVSYEPQSTVGDVCSRIFTRLSEELIEGCEPLLQVHDEIVVECPEGERDYVISMMREASKIVLNVSDVPFIIPIDISVGKNWKDCHET